MKRTLSLGLALSLGLVTMAATFAGNRIEYEVTGTVEASGAEDDVMMCGITEDPEFEARSLGEWVISFELPSIEPGEREALFIVAAPAGLIQHEGLSLDPRFRGTGQVVVKDAGTDDFGFKATEVEFSGTGLVNAYDESVDLKGKFSCGVM